MANPDDASDNLIREVTTNIVPIVTQLPGLNKNQCFENDVALTT